MERKLYQMSNEEFFVNLSSILEEASQNVFLGNAGLPKGTDYKMLKESSPKDVAEGFKQLLDGTRGLGVLGQKLEELKSGRYAMVSGQYEFTLSSGRTIKEDFSVGVRLRQAKDGKLSMLVVPVDRSVSLEQNFIYGKLSSAEQDTLRRYGVVGTVSEDGHSVGNMYQYDERMNAVFEARPQDLDFATSRGKFFGQELNDVQLSCLKKFQPVALDREGSKFIMFSPRDGELTQVTDPKLLEELKSGRVVNFVPESVTVMREEATAAEQQETSRQRSSSHSSKHEQAPEKQERSNGRRR